jgi:hypothetical protein
VSSTLVTFVATVAVLATAGYTVVKLTLHQPRDPFRTGAFEFDLAPGWWCETDGATYVCSPPGKPPYAAIVVIAMKERGDVDNRQAYEDFLKQPRQVTDSTGHTTMSVVSYVKHVKLGHTDWIEALHSGSEISNYDTYYLATANSYLAILVTMSVDKEEEHMYILQLTDMMKTLNVYQK